MLTSGKLGIITNRTSMISLDSNSEDCKCQSGREAQVSAQPRSRSEPRATGWKLRAAC